MTKLHVKNKGVKALFQHFENIEITLKNGKVVKCLKAVKDHVDLLYITNLITKFLYKFILHRNQLKHYRETSNAMKDLLEGYIDIDFSENLTVPVKFEPQSLHWSHEEITVHLGIIKMNGEKSYHPYLSMDQKHDHSCVEVVLNQMLCTIEVPSTIMIESDNCCSQYKCASHFHAIQEISNHYQTKIIFVYRIAEHGKGEVDHVGGLAKSAIRSEITIGGFFSDAEEMVNFLPSKFEVIESPKFVVKEIDQKILEETRMANKLKIAQTVDGSSSFQVIVFNPDSTEIKVSERRCICETCKNNYGTCSLFKSYTMEVTNLKETSLRSSVCNAEAAEIDDTSINNFDFKAPFVLLLLLKNHLIQFGLSTSIPSQQQQNI